MIQGPPRHRPAAGDVAPCATPAASAQNLDISGWSLDQTSSTRSYTIPDGTSVVPGSYVIICRDMDQGDFEAYFGVSLGPDVTYLRSSNSAPMINGAETYTLRDAGGTAQDGPTDAIGATKKSYHRADPETQAFSSIDEAPSPASGVEAPDAVTSGLVISEVTDVGALISTDSGAAAGDTPFNPGHDLRAAPNPFNPSATLGFTMPADGSVRVTVHDIKGRTVRTLVDGVREAGEHRVSFNGRDASGRVLASGVYLIRATGTGTTSWTKVVLSN